MHYALFLDIGNTTIKVGLADRDVVHHAFTMPTLREHTGDSLGLALLQILRQAELSPSRIEVVLTASVVPGLNPVLRQACRRFLLKDPIFVPEDLPIPLENRYADPSQVGADRLLGAFAACRMYPEHASIICVDYGTATTFDCVQDNAYLGGLICPGVFSSLGALADRTAKLPMVSLEAQSSVPEPGLSTSTSMNHGFLFGFAAMAEGLIAQLAKGLREKPFVLATGGFAVNLAKVVTCFNAVRTDLLLEGLRMLYAASAPQTQESGESGLIK